MALGFFYLVAVMDWFSRYVLSWRLSNSMDVDFCVEALEEALSRGTPGIFNTDQGSQFTSKEFTTTLKDQDVAISMDGKGRAIDNVMIERLWRTVKYEEVYLKQYETGADCYKGLGEYLDYYSHERSHQGLKASITKRHGKYTVPADQNRSDSSILILPAGGPIIGVHFRIRV